MASDIDAATTAECSWFCCGTAWGPCGSTGRGACGTCNSGSLQCAWPNTSDACFSITRPDRCGDTLLRRTCGHTFFVTSRCNGKQVTVKIADCGPQTDLWCGERTCCGGSNCSTDRLLDLTPAAYSRIASLSSGLTSISVHS